MDRMQRRALVLVLLNVPGMTFAKMVLRENEDLRFCSFGHFMTPDMCEHTRMYVNRLVTAQLRVGLPDFDSSSLSPWQM